MPVRVVLPPLSPREIDRWGAGADTGSINQAVHLLRRAALLLLAAGIVLLPASNAKLPLSAHLGIPWLLVAASTLWGTGRVLGWQPVRSHERAVWGTSAGVLAGGWAVTAFPRSIVERSSGVLLELDREWWCSFGSVDQQASIEAMVSISACLMVLVMVLDFAVERRGRHAIAAAVTLAGTVAAIVGLCWRNPTDLRAIWHVRHVPGSVFGWFWYHGNAAAFLSLTWPATLWLCALLIRNGVRRPLQQITLAILVAALLTQIIAVFVNVSKMGHLMFAAECAWILAASLMIWRPAAIDLFAAARRLFLFAVTGLGLVLLGAWLGGAEDGVTRWNVFAERRFDDPARRRAAVMAVRIGSDHGWAGTGPGTFEWVSAHYSPHDPLLARGRWRHAHNDYAQTFAEWGWLGVGLLGAGLFTWGWPLMKGVGRVFRQESRRSMSFDRCSGLVCVSAAFLAFLAHAAVDFPLQIDATRHLMAVVTGLALALACSPSAKRTMRRS